MKDRNKKLETCCMQYHVLASGAIINTDVFMRERTGAYSITTVVYYLLLKITNELKKITAQYICSF